jgi:mycoredoxin
VLTMYSTSWCGYCHRLKSQLMREGIAYRVVDIEADDDAAAYVMSVNGGNQTVPTLRFEDGSALTNPTIVEVKAHLATVGAAAVEQGDRGRVELDAAGLDG